jgi:hypothetical protein
MRNVPPTPANYAQRSGRGRPQRTAGLRLHLLLGGQPPRPVLLQASRTHGRRRVSPPRLDLANEDLLRAHVHAIWLAEVGLDLGETLGGPPRCRSARPDARLRLTRPGRLDDQPARQARVRTRARAALGGAIEEFAQATGSATSGSTTTREIPQQLQSRVRRWRSLYRAAMAQEVRQGKITRDAPAPRGRPRSRPKRCRATRPTPARPAHRAQRQRALGLLPLPLLRQRGLPARLQLPAPPALGLPDRGVAAERRRRLSSRARASWPSPSSARAPSSTTRVALRRQQGHPPCRGWKRDITVPSAVLRRLRRDAPASTAPRARRSASAAAPPAPARSATSFACRTSRPPARPHQLGRRRAPAASATRCDRRALPRARDRRPPDGQLLAKTAPPSRPSPTATRPRSGGSTSAGAGARTPMPGFSSTRARDLGARATLTRTRKRAVDEAHDRPARRSGHPLRRRHPQLPGHRPRRASSAYEGRDGLAAGRPQERHPGRVPARRSRARRRAAAQRGRSPPLLFYEAAEGGAGVLRRLVEDPQRRCPIVAVALELCHFDPDTGAISAAPRGARTARRPVTTASSPTSTSATTAARSQAPPGSCSPGRPPTGRDSPGPTARAEHLERLLAALRVRPGAPLPRPGSTTGVSTPQRRAGLHRRRGHAR